MTNAELSRSRFEATLSNRFHFMRALVAILLLIALFASPLLVDVPETNDGIVAQPAAPEITEDWKGNSASFRRGAQ